MTRYGNRTQTAEAIALRVRVFVRNARANGDANLITDLAIQEAAAVLEIPGDQFSMRTVWIIVRRECKRSSELGMVSAPGVSGR